MKTKASTPTTISNTWHSAPKRWGHPLHSICSYFAMFPPQVPNVFIHWLTKPGDVVFDPFSGRGTTPLEACRSGRLGLGSDLNPLAWLLTSAKINPPTEKELQKRLEGLESACRKMDKNSAPWEIQMLYDPDVLGQLLWLRENLNLRTRTDRFLMGIILGSLHANYNPEVPPRGLSISMPNTFSMAPEYVRRYIRTHKLKPPRIDIFEFLKMRLKRFLPPASGAMRGKAWKRDALSEVPNYLKVHPAKLVFTSPPYLNVIRYGKYNWIRLWMLNENPKAIDQKLHSTGSLSKYLQFMRTMAEKIKDSVRDDGYLCLMIGDVYDRPSETNINLAREVKTAIQKDGTWHEVTTIRDRLPVAHKVSRIWKNSPGNATKTDRILILSKTPKGLDDLPKLRPFDWSNTPEWALR